MQLWNDVRFALRQLRKTPAFTLIVLATLGLCIGVNTAVYSVLDAVLLRPAPVPRLRASRHGDGGRAEQGTGIRQHVAERRGVRGGTGQRRRALDVAAWSGVSGVNFAGEGRLEFVQQQRVSAGYFRVLGIAPQYGREFTRAEDVAGGPALVVLSHGFWQRVFHGDPAALGRPSRCAANPT